MSATKIDIHTRFVERRKVQAPIDVMGLTAPRTAGPDRRRYGEEQPIRLSARAAPVVPSRRRTMQAVDNTHGSKRYRLPSQRAMQLLSRLDEPYADAVERAVGDHALFLAIL